MSPKDKCIKKREEGIRKYEANFNISECFEIHPVSLKLIILIVNRNVIQPVEENLFGNSLLIHVTSISNYVHRDELMRSWRTDVTLVDLFNSELKFSDERTFIPS